MIHRTHYLIVDDDEDDRNLLIEIFRELAPEKILTVAEDGLHLLEQLELMEPDLILMDLNMPKKSGLECLADLKASSLYCDIPVVIYSTSADPAQVKETYSKGANLYIQKPISLAEIRKIIQRLLMIKVEDIVPQPPLSKFVIKRI